MMMDLPKIHPLLCHAGQATPQLSQAVLARWTDERQSDRDLDLPFLRTRKRSQATAVLAPSRTVRKTTAMPQRKEATSVHRSTPCLHAVPKLEDKVRRLKPGYSDDKTTSLRGLPAGLGEIRFKKKNPSEKTFRLPGNIHDIRNVQRNILWMKVWMKVVWMKVLEKNRYSKHGE